MAVNKLNRLEKKAIAGDDARWEQAAEIVRRLEKETEREIAKSWINGRTGEPYHYSVVHEFAVTHRHFAGGPPAKRPPFWEGRDTAIGAPSTRTQRSEAQPPKSVETAEKLVTNMIEKSPQEVINAVMYGLVDASRKGGRERREAIAKTLFQQYAKGIWEIIDLAERMKDEVPEAQDREPMLRMTQTLRGFADRIEAYLKAPEDFDWDAFDEERREWTEATQ